MHTDKLPYPWLLLFPATYLLHILEEYWAGEGFHRWIRRIARITLTSSEFLAINAALWVAMVLAIFGVRSFSTEGWIVIALATIVTINGAGHLFGTLYTRSYSPGVATGLGLWVPFGIYTLVRTCPLLSAVQLWIGLFAGLVVQALVSLLAMMLGQNGKK